jgi:hypothetical protein
MNLRKWRELILIASLALSLSLIGCGKKESSNIAGTSESKMESTAKAPSESTSLSVETSESAPSTSEASEDSGTYGDSKASESSKATEESSIVIENRTTSNQQISSGQLTAGEWSDLQNWDWWVKLLINQEWDQYQKRWDFFTLKKLEVIVKDGQNSVQDAKVTLYDKQGNSLWSTKTDNKGTAYLFAELYSTGQNTVFDVTVEDGQNSRKIEDVRLSPSEPLYVEFNESGNGSTILDLMFVIDTTGSMQDELDYLTAELKNVIKRTSIESSDNLDIRLSCNYYRDHGDEYVVRSSPFTKNIDEVIKDMNKQYADGGGDFEEAVEEALKDAVENHQWSTNARARLLFLVLDAPPHYTDNNVKTLQNVISKAASEGIRIIPVASSGIDKDTESLLRFFSISTGGTYVFLTDHSGIGNSHIEPTIGNYKIEFLNDLLVRIIKEYTK